MPDASPRRGGIELGGDARPILIVLHQESSTPGRIGQMLAQAGIGIDIRRPVLGDALPATLDEHRGAIVFGGPPSANDPDDYLRRETDWMAVPLREDRPLLGICLGAQMLSRHLGGTVTLHPEGLVEIGYYPLEATPEGEAFVPGWPPMIYQWHREGFSLPGGADLLARSPTFPNQAFRIGRAVAIQFHVELTLAMVHRWTTRGHERLLLPGAQDRATHLQGRALYDRSAREWLERLLGTVFPPGV